MKKTLTVLLALTLATGLGAAQELEVSPSNFYEELYSGDKVQEELEVTWHGEAKTVVDMEANVSYENNTQLNEGIDVEFSTNEFVLDSGETREVEATIDFDSALKPGIYFIQLGAGTETEIESEVIEETVVVDRTEDVSEEFEEQIRLLEEELNQTKQQLDEERQELEELEQIKQDLEQAGEDTEEISRTIEQQRDTIESLESNEVQLQDELQHVQLEVENLEEENQYLRYGLISLGVLSLVLLLAVVTPRVRERLQVRKNKENMDGMPDNYD